MSEAKYRYWEEIIRIAKDSGIEKETWCRQNCISIKTFNHYEGIFRRKAVRGCGSVEADNRTENQELGQKEAICETDFSRDAFTEMEGTESRSTLNVSWHCGKPEEKLPEEGSYVKTDQGSGTATGTRESPFVEVPIHEIFGDGNNVTYEVVEKDSGMAADDGCLQQEAGTAQAGVPENWTVVIWENAGQADGGTDMPEDCSGVAEENIGEEREAPVKMNEEDTNPRRVTIRIRECRLTVGEDIREDVLQKIMKVVMPDA